VLLPSFQLLLVCFGKSPIFQLNLLTLYSFACEVFYNPV